MLDRKNTPASTKTNIPMARYTHCTRFNACTSSAVSVKKAYEPKTGPTTVPMALNAWAKLIRISAYFGGPQTIVVVPQLSSLSPYIATFRMAYRQDKDWQRFPETQVQSQLRMLRRRTPRMNDSDLQATCRAPPSRTDKVRR